MKTLLSALVLLSFVLLVTSPSSSQHDHSMTSHNLHGRGTPDATSDSTIHAHTNEVPGGHGDGILSGLPMSRDGSGTSWLPDAGPVHSYHQRLRGWDAMLHGTAFVRYSVQDVFGSGRRGDRTFDSPNWIMLAAQRSVSTNSRISFRSMLTLDPITVGKAGYPLLLQTGEAFEGKPVIDRQHPHDLFAELAAIYSYSLSSNTNVFAYLGMPGEPALGPPAFMHRPSSRHNPDAPLSHHWQDATHIVFGVMTIGIRHGMLKLDGSVFTGREPDEERYDFDRPRFDSYSVRISVNPSDRLAFQVSRGLIKRPEILEPEIDKVRTTASALYSLPLAGGGDWSTAAVWGVNAVRSDHGGASHGHGTQHAFLIESDLDLGTQAIYVRAEWVEKSPGELGLADEIREEKLNVRALTFGTARDVAAAGGFLITLGGQATVYQLPSSLESHYGSRPVSAQIYLRLSPVGR